MDVLAQRFRAIVPHLDAAMPNGWLAIPRGERAARVARSESLASGARFEVRTLGSLEIRVDGRVVPSDALRHARSHELLLHLLAHRGGRTREQIGLALWPGVSPVRLTDTINAALRRIRAALGPIELIAVTGDRYRVNWALGVELDAAAFADRAREALRAEASSAIPRLRDAMALYRGDFLAGVRAGAWHLAHRDHLRRLYADVALRLGDLLTRASHHADSADVYRTLVAREPLHEKTQRRLMTALARAGRRDDALRQYDRLVAVLRTELEAAPEPETVALAVRLRHGESA